MLLTRKGQKTIAPFVACLFVLIYFLALLEATSENALDMFKREARERELERRVEATRREQVHMIGDIYIEPLTSCEPTVDEVRIFEQEKRSRDLEEELEPNLNFRGRTVTFIPTLEPQLIVISDLEEEVEIILQSIAKEQAPQAF